MRDVAGVDEGHRKATRRKHLQQRHPVYACRFHDDRRDPTGRQPVGATRQITRKGTKCLDRLAIAVCRHTAPMLLSAYLNACGMGMNNLNVARKSQPILKYMNKQ